MEKSHFLRYTHTFGYYIIRIQDDSSYWEKKIVSKNKNQYKLKLFYQSNN